MTPDLRPYQLLAKNLLREKFSQNIRRIINHSPTGTGKGLMMSDLVNSITSKGIPVLSVMAGRNIVFQTVKNYHKYHGIVSSIIMGNERGFNPNLLSQICSIDTLRSRDIDFVKNFRYIITDEAHMTNADRYQNFYAKLPPDAYHIGYTATPYNYLTFWDDVIVPITPRQARDQGWLVPVIHYAPKDQINTSNIKMAAGEFNQTQLAEESSKITGDIVEHWKKFGENRPTVCFGVNKNHSQMIADAFNAVGIPARHLDESDSKDKRDQAIADVQSGKLKILCNVNIFSVGVDIPELSCAICARPTMSEIVYIQQLGRILRPCFNKYNAIILDHAGNIFRHGDVYEERKARIGGKKDRNTEKVIHVVTCEKCYAVRPRGNPICPQCGHVNEKIDRFIEHVDGELSTITEVDLRFLRIQKDLQHLTEQSNFMGWKPFAKYFKLYDKFGDDIFIYMNQLQLPFNLYNMVHKN
jgi:DNA repair protein RadD